MAMRTREKHTDDQPLRPMSRGRALLFKIWGPAESWDNPLMGTRFDPRVKQRRAEQRHADRDAHRAERRRARAEQRAARAEEPAEHFTPDE
jgi:hypothetical protein